MSNANGSLYCNDLIGIEKSERGMEEVDAETV